MHRAFSANAYLTPDIKGLGALNPHGDAHDVVILQIEGKKRWKLCGRDFGPAIPVEEQAYNFLEGEKGVLPRFRRSSAYMSGACCEAATIDAVARFEGVASVKPFGGRVNLDLTLGDARRNG